MVPADDEHMDSTEATSDTNKKEREPARLTPMPGWLMKWWIPILLALILLAAGWLLASIWRMPPRPVLWWTINPYWPPSWPFNYHWPSKDAMALCATIAGGGFAFSAWQQRSHDNAAKAKQAQATAEREDYWKRREHIYKLLGSENPGLRLSAVALLAELADSATHSNFLNKTEKQQLQRHIIDTLCLQVRHEGLDISSEGTTDEHAKLQRTIIDTLFRRISVNSIHTSPTANWSHETLELTNCQILAEITLDNVSTEATINLNNTEFDEKLRIRGPKIGNIQWETARFHKGLEIGKRTETTVLTLTNLPLNTTEAKYINTTFLIKENSFTINIEEGINDRNKAQTLIFEGCSFYHLQHCKCLPGCTCELQNTSETCACSKNQQCSCNESCINSIVKIMDLRAIYATPTQTPKLVFHQCHIGSLKANLTLFHLQLTATENHIYNAATLNFFDRDLQNDNIRYPEDSDIMINFSRNLFITPGSRTKYKNTPFDINIHTDKALQLPIRFGRNFVTSSRNTDEVPETLLSLWGYRDKHPDSFHELTCSQLYSTSEQFHFKEHYHRDQRSYIGDWSTGRTTRQNPQ